MTLTTTTINNAPTLTPTPSDTGGQFMQDLADYHGGNLQNIRFAHRFPDADLGGKINAAVTNLGARGGIVYIMTPSLTEYSTTIDLTAAHGISLIGCSVPPIMSGAVPDLGSYLKYTGNGWGIDVGDGVSALYSTKIHGLTLELASTAAGGLRCSGEVYGLRLSDLFIEGPGVGESTDGILFDYVDPDNSILGVADGVKVRNCDVGIEQQAVNGALWLGCEVNNCNSGWVFDGCDQISIYGGACEQSTDEAFDVKSCRGLLLSGIYHEGGLFATFGETGGGGGAAQDVTIVNCRMDGGGITHLVKINRMQYLNVLGGYAKNATTAIFDNSAQAGTCKQLREIGMHRELNDAPAIPATWDGFDDVVVYGAQADNANYDIYPNLPIADPSINGAFFRTGNDLRVSTG